MTYRIRALHRNFGRWRTVRPERVSTSFGTIFLLFKETFWANLEKTLSRFYRNFFQIIDLPTSLLMFFLDGITVPEIKKWPGSLFGFTFHCWFSLNQINDDESEITIQGSSTYRRQIFTYDIYLFFVIDLYILPNSRLISLNILQVIDCSQTRR